MEYSDDRLLNRLDKIDERLGKLETSVANIEGKMTGGATPQDGSQIFNRQNGIAVALAGLITTVGTVITSVFTSH